jgi:PEP-CTERM motif
MRAIKIALAAAATLATSAALAASPTPLDFGTINAGTPVDIFFTLNADTGASFTAEITDTTGNRVKPTVFQLFTGPTFADPVNHTNTSGRFNTLKAYDTLTAGNYKFSLQGVTGTYAVYQGSGVAATLTPVPEPTGTILALAGVGVAGLLLSRRKVS